jgi:ferric-dicitrate binding protein FerR (iron transport regulator)
MEKPNQQIIQKFITNTCSNAEHKLIMRYLNSLDDTELNSFLESHFHQIELETDKTLPSLDKKFDSLLTKLKPVKHHQTYLGKRYVYSIAASFILLMVLGAFTLYLLGVFPTDSQGIIWTENVTQIGQKLVLSLPDGSDITLNGGSKLRYPQKFEAQIRDVYLEGEAFFNIVHDSSKPFIVHTNNISTTVLGTKFDVRAFSNSDEISVSLVEGKVKVTNKEKNGIKGNIVLKPSQKLVYNSTNDVSEVKGFDYLQEVGWKDNILVFDDEPLEKVFTRLELAYGIKFELNNKNKSYEKIKITTKFENSTLSTVNEVIKKLTGLEYETISTKNIVTKVIFYKKRSEESRN